MSITRSPLAPEPATSSRPQDGAAQGTSRPQARVLLVGHGSERCPAAFRVIERHADALQQRNPLRQVHAAALFGEGSLQRGLSGLRGEPVFIVPMFMCDGLTVRNVLPQALREATDALPKDAGVDVRTVVCEPIGLSPAIADLAADKALAAAANWSTAPANLCVLLCAHGSRQNPASEQGANLQAGRLRAEGLFRQVVAVFLEQAPHLTDVLARERSPIVVVGLFSGGSRHATLDIEKAVAVRSQAHLAYLGAVGDDDGLVDIIEAAIEKCICKKTIEEEQLIRNQISILK